MQKLFLHTCCGPCFLGVWEEVKNKFEVTNFFYNPNIQPGTEYKKRLENLKMAAKDKSQEIVEIGQKVSEHSEAILGIEKRFPSRCIKCYELRLKKTAIEARIRGFRLFSTTLLISPYQQHEALKELGNRIASEAGIEFYYFDWRPYFREGQKTSIKMNIYRQKYCGCKWSKTEQTNKS